MRMLNRRIGICAAAVALGLGATAAWATWTASGTGAGRADAAVAVGVTTAITTQTGKALHPGGHGDLVVHFSNPNDFPVEIVAVTRDGLVKADPAHAAAGCTDNATGVSFVAPVIDGPWRVEKRGTREVVLMDALVMSDSSANACQGATFTAPVSIIARSTT